MSMERIAPNFDPAESAELILKQLGLSPSFSVLDENGCITKEAVETLGDLAEKIFRLANKVVQGFNVEREMEKLRRRIPQQLLKEFNVMPTDCSQGTTELNFPDSVPVQQNPHWSRKNKIAEEKISRSGCFFTRILERPTLRGPGRHAK